jgi:hypothetical protein
MQTQLGAPIDNASVMLACMEEIIIRCNICDEMIGSFTVAQHVAGRNHAVKKKVAEFHEMNAQVKSSYQHDTSVVRAWISDLYNYDFLSTGRT